MQQISRDKFDRFQRATTEFTLCVVDRNGLRDHWPARPTLTPQIRFLYIGSRFCSTLPSDPASQRRLALRYLHLYQVVNRTFTSTLSNMRGVRKKRAGTFVPARDCDLVALRLEGQPEAKLHPPGVIALTTHNTERRPRPNCRIDTEGSFRLPHCRIREDGGVEHVGDDVLEPQTDTF